MLGVHKLSIKFYAPRKNLSRYISHIGESRYTRGGGGAAFLRTAY